MIKFSIIFVVIYLLLLALTKLYISSLDKVDQYRLLVLNLATKRQTIWFTLMWLMTIASILIVAVDIIYLAIKYL